jgi:hypothetical protein
VKAAALALTGALLFGFAAVTGGWPPAATAFVVDGIHMHRGHGAGAAPGATRVAVAFRAIAFPLAPLAPDRLAPGPTRTVGPHRSTVDGRAWRAHRARPAHGAGHGRGHDRGRGRGHGR